MALTEDHFARISGFIHGRLDEVFADIHRDPQHDNTGTARILRALRRTVTSLNATGGFVAQNEERHRLAVLIAWNDLSEIAKQWDDHPDFHPDFAKTSNDLAAAPAAAETSAGKD